MRLIQSHSDGDVAKWLNLNVSQWERLKDPNGIVHFCTSIIELQQNIENLQWFFTVIHSDLAIHFTSMLETLAKLQDVLSSCVQHPTILEKLLENEPKLEDLTSTFQGNELKSYNAILAAMENRKVAILYNWVIKMPNKIKEVLPKVEAQLNEIWSTYEKQVSNEVQFIYQSILSLGKFGPVEKLSLAVTKVRSNVLKESLKEAARTMQERSVAKFGTYLDEVQQLDFRTTQFVFTVLLPISHKLYTFRTDQPNVKAPKLYGAKVTEPKILDLLEQYLVDHVQGKYSFKVYNIDNVSVLLYDNWIISTRPTTIEGISEANMKTAKISFNFASKADAIAAPGSHAVIRCTFTANAVIDDTFIDWLRSLGANKVGRQVWDIPVKNTQDAEELKVKIKKDWGYPYIYENIESPGFMHKIFDVKMDGAKWASVIRLAVVDKLAFIKKEKGKYCVKSESNKNWNGGCYDTKEKAEKRLKEVEFFKHKKAAPESKGPYIQETKGKYCIKSRTNKTWSGGCFKTKEEAKKRLKDVYYFRSKKAGLSIEARTALVSKLEKAASVSNHAERITKVADDVRVAASWLIADNVKALSDNTLLLTPDVGSTIVLGDQDVTVTGHCNDLFGWLQINGNYILTKPDINSNVALLHTEDFEDIKTAHCEPCESDDAVSAFEVDPASMYNIPTHLVVNIDNVNYIIDEDDLEDMGMRYSDDESRYAPRLGEITLDKLQEHEKHMYNLPGVLPSRSDLTRWIPLKSKGLINRLNEKADILTKDQLHHPHSEITINETLADEDEEMELEAESPVGGMEHSPFMQMPSSMPAFRYPNGPGFIYYPTPTKMLAPMDLEHYKGVPTTVENESPVVKNLVSPGKVPVKLMPPAAEMDNSQFTHHPENSKLQTNQDPGPEGLFYTLNPLVIQKSYTR